MIKIIVNKISYHCFLFFLFGFFSLSAQEQMQFMAIDDELSNKWISSIAQDDNNFLWVGTRGGIHRYDGHRFDTFQDDFNLTDSVSINSVLDIAVDNRNNVWFTTYEGKLFNFSPSKMKINQLQTTAFGVKTAGKKHILCSGLSGFTVFNTENQSHFNIGKGQFHSPMDTFNEKIWFIDKGKILYSYEITSKKLTKEYVFNNRINVIKYLPEKGILAISDKKIMLLENGVITKETPTPILIKDVAIKQKGDLFVVSSDTLAALNTEKFQLEYIKTNLELNQIRKIFIDKKGTFWIATLKGLFKEKKYNSAFLPSSFHKRPKRIIKHKNKIYAAGFNALHKIENNIAAELITNTLILSIYNENDTLYATSSDSKIFKLINDRVNDTLRHASNFTEKTLMLGICRDHSKRLWVGSYKGLHIFDHNDAPLKFIPLDNSSKERVQINNLKIDSKDRLWIITSNDGIYMLKNASRIPLDAISKSLIHYNTKAKTRKYIFSDNVETVEEDSQGQLWFGTNMGILKYIETTGTFQKFIHQNEAFVKDVQVIREDNHKNLWIATPTNGLYVYSQKTKTFSHFTTNDGLISNWFLFGAGTYDSVSKKMYFGSLEGLQEIDLSKNIFSPYKTTPFITAININSKKGAHISALQAPFLNQITLEPDENDFSIRFSAVNFKNPEKIGYLYRLNNDSWKTTDLQTAYFTNIPYGKHELKVKTLYEGIKNENATTLKIYIRPPWYLSIYAKMGYLMLILGIFYVIYHFLKWRWKLQFSLKTKVAEAAHFKQLNAFKSKLYTDIAHEFKTPLTLISGPVENKLEEKNLTQKERRNFSMVQRNTHRLTTLVDQLLELSKLENGELQLKIKQGNLGAFLKILATSFNYEAEEKQLHYEYDINSITNAWYDEDIIEKIVINLLTNAFKYVSVKGRCYFSATTNDDILTLNVKNSVINGQELHLEKFFDRFYQQDSGIEGIGVGLSLVKELIEFYQGNIDVQLENINTICFTVNLPIFKKAFKSTHIITASEENNDPLIDDLEIKNETPIVLIVDDDDDIRSYVKEILNDTYKIITANNGEIGLKKAISSIPDIIISDIRMPHYDGITLCNTLKNDERTSHIPVILLTADTDNRSELKGLASGADDFVTKPFKVTILKQRIANLITIRQKLRERYSKEMTLKPKKIAIAPAEEVFLNKIQQILDEHLTNPHFNAVMFSEKAHMSRMQLHRKLQVYTGLSTTAFIRSQRLKQAIHLLKTTSVTVNEVAYAVGFNTPSYFMKCFKENYEKTPLEYIKNTDK
ncbi:response regulator [Flavobacteriaceae bacterium R38]|nr:response regulator [Flavobacteriaceae bacterium R38]